MRSLFGAVSLLIVLAIVGMVAVKQLRAVGKTGGAAATAQSGAPAVPQMSGSGSVRDQSRELQNKVVDDVAKAMKQGVEARSTDAEKQ